MNKLEGSFPTQPREEKAFPFRRGIFLGEDMSREYGPDFITGVKNNPELIVRIPKYDPEDKPETVDAQIENARLRKEGFKILEERYGIKVAKTTFIVGHQELAEDKRPIVIAVTERIHGTPYEDLTPEQLSALKQDIERILINLLKYFIEAYEEGTHAITDLRLFQFMHGKPARAKKRDLYLVDVGMNAYPISRTDSTDSPVFNAYINDIGSLAEDCEEFEKKTRIKLVKFRKALKNAVGIFKNVSKESEALENLRKKVALL